MTNSFDIVDHPEILCEFFWCFAHLSDAARGYDLSVAAATRAEKQLFIAAVQRHVLSQCPDLQGRALKTAVKTHVADEVVSAMDISEWATGQRRRCLVSRPVVFPLSPTGRATRGYWALDTTMNQIVFLKDTWRYDEEVTGGIEGLVLEKLNNHNVSSVPPVVCHGDVPAYDYVPPVTTVGDCSDVGSLTTTGQVD